jgi:hypothetical protein
MAGVCYICGGLKSVAAQLPSKSSNTATMACDSVAHLNNLHLLHKSHVFSAGMWVQERQTWLRLFHDSDRLWSFYERAEFF